MKKISRTSQILLAACAVALVAMTKLPIWKIYLTAPQYPEGLEMNIWSSKLTGDVSVISALNHYIGMRAISAEMFPELGYLTSVIYGVAALCLALALIGRFWSALLYYIVLAIGDTLAIWDFWRWGYDYGHNLNPEAPIVIPGMAYQPPVIGYKKLLNFEAWSLPDVGGWILIVATSVALAVVAWEWWRNRSKNQPDKRTGAPKTASKSMVSAASMLLLVAANGCSSGGPVPINFGKDNCDNCRMTLTDRHFGCEIITQKGKAYKFDDLNCMVSFLKKETVKPQDVAARFVVNHSKSGSFVAAEKALYLHSEKLNSPMASSLAAFETEAEWQTVQTALGGERWTWEQVLAEF